MRTTRTRVIGALAASLAVGALVTACAGGSAAPSASSDRDDTVIIGTGATPQTLDPILASDVQTDFTVGGAYDKLIDYDDDGAIVPLVATEWTYNDDATAVTLTLRDDVVFHSGNPLTAADVVYTLDRIASLGIGVSSFLSSYASSTAVDDTTVEIALNGTNTTFVGALSKVYLLDSALVSENEGSDQGQAWLATNDAGSGPYVITDYTANQQATLERFEDSWRFDEHRPDSLVYRYITESSTLRDELKSGGVDVVTGLTGTDLDALASQDGVYPQELSSMLQLFVMMNTQDGITTDPKVREAIQLAYDYDGHISSILSGRGQVATGLTAPSVSCRVDTGAAKQDVAAAKALIADAGAEGQTLTLAYQSQIPEHQKAATLLQSNLKDIGITLELKTVTYPEYVAMIESPETTPDLALLWDFPYYPEIGPMLYRVYDSQFIGQTNYAQYSNPDVDALLEQGIATVDPDAACDLFTRAQELILADDVSVNISNPTTTVMLRDGIEGLEYAPTYQLFDPKMLVLAD
ncbi:ABC transporter substrate-binding protein [Microbacterium trichothecenolyticum]|uniref:ABC transporter substrate-binding protein n=1 Tax=Microbacterium trichothecenolyticum TaxID=69370 RepID=UPI0035BE486E